MQEIAMKTLILMLAILSAPIALADYENEVSSAHEFQQEMEQQIRDGRDSLDQYQRQIDAIGQDSRDFANQQQQDAMQYDLQRIREYQRRGY
jgi:uncharacterized UBP type Zn finger protein